MDYFKGGIYGIIFVLLILFATIAFAGETQHKCELMLFDRKGDYKTFLAWRFKTTWMCDDEKLYVVDDPQVYATCTERAKITTNDDGEITVFEIIPQK